MENQQTDKKNIANESAELINNNSAQEESLPSKIGFPPKVLIENPIRFDVIAAKKGAYTAISKPVDILFDSYLGSKNCKSVMLAMREQQGKNEFARLGITAPYAVNQIDYEMSGAALMAADKDIATAMRNAIWSGAFKFEYILLCKTAQNKEEKFNVNLPILMHDERPVWLVSHRFGKKADTSFELIEKVRGYQIWKATASSVRPHQIRVHASESGLKIVGDWLYSKTSPIFLSALKDEYQLRKNSEEKPLYDAMCLHLSKITFDGKDFERPDIGKVEIECPLPKGFKVCLKKLNFEFSK